MKILRFIPKNTFPKGSGVAIGNFDGVHLGHQALIKILINKAKLLNIPSVVMIFEPQPNEYFKNEAANYRLTEFREKIILLQGLKVDYVYCIKFNENFANLSAIDFAEHILFNLLNCKYILIGQDFRFGNNKQGDAAFLKQLSLKNSCLVETFEDFLFENARLSSSLIRKYLTQGNLAIASKCLGRVYSWSGRITYGNGLAKTWQVPTANIRPRKQIPLHGIFCVQVKFSPENKIYNGVASIGFRPTIDNAGFFIEVHIFDFNKNVYGERMEIFFLKKLRDEIKFPTISALVAQIKTDIIQTKEYFKTSLD